MCLWKMDRISRAKTSNRTERGSKPSIWFRVRCFCWSHFYSDGCCVLSCSVSISRLVFDQLLLFFTILSVFRIARSFGERKGKVKSTSRAVLVHAVERGDLTLPWGNPVLFESPAGRTCFRRLGQPQSVHQLASTRSFLARFFFFSFFLSFLLFPTTECIVNCRQINVNPLTRFPLSPRTPRALVQFTLLLCVLTLIIGPSFQIESDTNSLFPWQTTHSATAF